jgi:hypothetical protein
MTCATDATTLARRRRTTPESLVTQSSDETKLVRFPIETPALDSATHRLATSLVG